MLYYLTLRMNSVVMKLINMHRTSSEYYVDDGCLCFCNHLYESCTLFLASLCTTI